MRMNYENCLGLVNRGIYYVGHRREIYRVLPYSMDLKAPRELWNVLGETTFSKCSFIWHKGPANIWIDCKAQSNLYVGHVNMFLIFDIACRCFASAEVANRKMRVNDFITFKKLLPNEPILHYIFWHSSKTRI